MSESRVITGYADAAEALIGPYEALSCDEIYQHVVDLMPAAPSRVIDIGAGTGRDAAWLAAQGHVVTAVEPVAAFRGAGQRLHGECGICWIDDRLPSLAATRAQNERFDLLLLAGVWHHLPPPERAVAWLALADLMAPGAVMILSLRHGPGPSGRPVYPVTGAEIALAAADLGLTVMRQRRASSIQPGNLAAGVGWTWVVLGAARSGGRR